MLDSKKPPWGKLHQISVCQMRQHSSSNELLWVLLYILDSLKIDVISKSGWLDTHTSLSIPTPHIPTSPFNGASLSTPYIYIHTDTYKYMYIKSNAYIQRMWRRPASRIYPIKVILFAVGILAWTSYDCNVHGWGGSTVVFWNSLFWYDIHNIM